MQSYLASLAEAGETHTLIQDHTATLERFFVLYDPASCTHEQVEAFCRGVSSHGTPSHQTVKRRRQAIRGYYDHALEQGVFTGNNPARPVPKEELPLFVDANWQRCYEHFLQDLKNRSGSEASVIAYAGILTRFFGEHPDPCAVSRDQVADFIYSPTYGTRAPGSSPKIATVNSRSSVLRSFYNFASSFTVASPHGPEPLFRLSNPTLGFRFGKPARVYKSLSVDEIRAFFAQMSDPNDVMQSRDRAVFWCYLLTCRRRSELAGLLWGSIQLGTVTDEDGTMRHAYTFTFFGKGHAGQEDRQELPEKAMAEIKHFLELTGRWDTMKPGDPVFACLPNQHGPSNVKPGELRPLTGSTIAKRLKVYCRRAGIDEKKFSMHSLRHTSAFLRKLAGEDLFSISRALRHSSLDTTKIYLDGLSCSGDRGGQRITDHLAKYGIT